ncbi:DUF2510 domain-containing protein [Streptomyces sp. NPDC088387]|uniref:DUF2510 domain-containing protein n=1 Tax=Streptomyces sp. NPDC088387 TaxID=3365859 RepID=UPI00382B64B0
MTPPPGWYRDPSAPHLERWWDGVSWTEHRRAPEPVTPPVPGPAVPDTPAPGPYAEGPYTQGPYTPGPYPSGQPTPASTLPLAPAVADGASTRAKAIAMTVAGAVLVAAIVTGAVVLRDGDTGGADTQAEPGPTATTSEPSAPPSTPEASPAPEDPSVVVDQLNGITFPLLDGWERAEHVAQEDAVMTTDGTYDCPGAGSVCRYGTVLSRTVTENTATSPEAIAKGDIQSAADDAYDRDAVGQLPFGGIESHKQVAAGPVAVAGRAGYYVRWRVKTELGEGGYVQSLAFQSSTGTETPVLVRYVFDAGEDAPPLSDMDRITKGIRSIDDAATGGGVGSSVGP